MPGKNIAPLQLKKGKIIAGVRYDSAWKKARGLMFRSEVSRPLIFIFSEKKRHSLHMLFVFCPIDVLFLDGKRKVVDIKQNFRPFTFYTPRKPCQYVIEMAAGSIKKSRTKIGDRIAF
jgi:uncharacterized protein